MTNEEFLREISLEGEVWKDIDGYEGLYLVSNMGRFVGLERTSKTKAGWTQKFHAILLKTSQQVKSEHQTIFLCKNGIPKSYCCHRLVAFAFIPNPNNLPVIDHIDGNPKNNRVSNLRWTDYKGNQNNPITRKRMSESAKKKDMSRFEKPIVRILPDGSVIKYKSIKNASMDGFDKTNIHRVLKGQRLFYKKCRWMYLSDYEASCQ